MSSETEKVSLARHCISCSYPFLSILAQKHIDKKIKSQLISAAPQEFFVCLTACAILIRDDKITLNEKERYREAINLLASKTTTLKIKKKLLISATPHFFESLGTTLYTYCPTCK